jgi:hypothetical protein
MTHIPIPRRSIIGEDTIIHRGARQHFEECHESERAYSHIEDSAAIKKLTERGTRLSIPNENAGGADRSTGAAPAKPETTSIEGESISKKPTSPLNAHR